MDMQVLFIILSNAKSNTSEAKEYTWNLLSNNTDTYYLL